MRYLIYLFAGILWCVPVSTRAGVVPNDAEVAGLSIAEWSAEWWKWVFFTPTNQNPLFDIDGRFATVHNDGPVFFLAGVQAISSTQTRRFSVPEDRYLFMPLVNIWVDNVATDPPFTLEELRDFNDINLASVEELHASLDGVSFTNLFAHRATAPIFSFEYTFEDNLHSWLVGATVLGMVDPMVTDGYYLMLEPLPPGPHTLTFGGTIGNFHFTLDITNHITVTVNFDYRLNRLLTQATSAAVPVDLRATLRALLETARRNFASGDMRAGIRALQDFKALVRTRLSRVNGALATELIKAANSIIDAAKSPKKEPKTA